MNKRYLWIVVLMAYIFFVIYLAVISRGIVDLKDSIRLDLFQCYYMPIDNSYKDAFVIVIGFIPVGVLVGLLFDRYRLAKASLAGLLVSLTIELSQLIWHRGVFDVNDLFNNALGALIGGVFAVGL